MDHGSSFLSLCGKGPNPHKPGLCVGIKKDWNWGFIEIIYTSYLSHANSCKSRMTGPRDYLACLHYVIPQVFISKGKESRAHTSVEILGFPVCYDPFHSYSPVSGTGIASSTAVGTSTLVMGDKIIKKLSAQVDTDLSYLENSASHLETQVDSLDEVVDLQNRRGLGLLFRGQGALCMMLGETHCFSINQSGRIREGLSMSDVTSRTVKDLRNPTTDVNLSSPG